jgi:hypothetical protein
VGRFHKGFYCDSFETNFIVDSTCARLTVMIRYNSVVAFYSETPMYATFWLDRGALMVTNSRKETLFFFKEGQVFIWKCHHTRPAKFLSGGA